MVLATEREHGLEVERAQRAQVDDLGVDPVVGELVGRGERVAHALADRDDREVAARARDARLPERDRLDRLGDLAP